MKQKNVIAIAVAVGFGLIAMLLASRITTPPPQQAVEEVDVPVAAQNIPPEMKFTVDKLPPISSEWVTTKKWPKTGLPPEYIGDPKNLFEKRSTHEIKAGALFTPVDVTTGGVLALKESMYTIPLSSLQAAGGFATPGKPVDILATFPLLSTKGPTVFPLLKSVRIVAVDTVTSTQPGQPAVAGGSMSFDVTPRQGLILKMAVERGASLTLLLPGDKEVTYPKEVPQGEEEVWKILLAEYTKGTKKKDGDPSAESDSAEVASFAGDVAAGTKITENMIDVERKIEMVKMSKPLPEGAVEDPRKLVGKFITRSVGKGQLLLKSLVDDKYEGPAPTTGKAILVTTGLVGGTQITKEMIKDEKVLRVVDVTLPRPDGAVDDPEKIVGMFLQRNVSAGQLLSEGLLGKEYVEPKERPMVKGGPPDGESTPKSAPPTEKPDIPRFHDVTLQTASGVRVFRYQVFRDGSTKFMGPAPVDVGPSKDETKPDEPKTPDPKKPVL